MGGDFTYVVHWNRLIPSFKWVSEYQSKKFLLNYTNTQLIFNTVSMFLIDFTGLHLTQLEKKAQRKKKKGPPETTARFFDQILHLPFRPCFEADRGRIGENKPSLF